MTPASSAAASNRANTDIPGAVGAHPPMPGPDRLPRPEHLGHIPPGDPTPVPVDDPLDHLAGIPKRPALLTRPRRQQILDQRPLSIREQLKPRHDLSLRHNTRNICQTRPSRLVSARPGRSAGSGQSARIATLPTFPVPHWITRYLASLVVRAPRSAAAPNRERWTSAPFACCRSRCPTPGTGSAVRQAPPCLPNARGSRRGNSAIPCRTSGG